MNPISRYGIKTASDESDQGKSKLSSGSLVELVTWLDGRLATNMEAITLLATIRKSIPLAKILSKKAIVEITTTVNTSSGARDQLLSIAMVFTSIASCEDHGYQKLVDLLLEALLRTNGNNLKAEGNLLDERIQDDIFIDGDDLRSLLDHNPWFVIIVLSYFI